MKKSVIYKELLLILTTFIWGMGFIAQSIGGAFLDAFSFNLYRNIVASLFLFVCVLIGRFRKKKKGLPYKDSNPKHLLLGGGLMGIALAVAMVLQQEGINHEGAGKAGFLTALYIVIIPIINRFFGKKIRPILFLAIVLSLTGLYLINSTEDGFSFGTGVVLLLLCAFAYSCQILLIDHFSPSHDSIELSFIQFFTATILLVPCSFIFGTLSLDGITQALPSILFLGICSSGIAYTLQMYSQSEVPVTIATIIMSLESVFSLFFGMLFLNEEYKWYQFLGCACIFAAVLISQLKIKSKGDPL